MKVNILISTIDEGIDRVGNVVLSPRNDVSYIVSHQYTDDKYKYVPAELEREDITVSHIAGRGVTKSRNNAIAIADGDIALFSDDDVTYRDSDIDAVRKTFRQNSAVDVAIFKIRTPAGEPEYKKYPDKIIEYQHAPCVGTVQIAFRVDKIKERKILFDERFGAGQPLLIGNDEKLFLHDCINAGLKVVFFPKFIVEHPYESTSKGIPKYDKRKIWVEGGVDYRMHGPVAIPKAFIKTISMLPDLLRHRVNPIIYCYHRLSAIVYVWKTRNQMEKLYRNNKKTFDAGF
ncbi:Glycosyl transferase family 2 [Fodinibius roseus]|uniref:Glycosyl transferase family 2 n=1 Tax=Fodinibius roseus TaxID=1194090 RepID=A0A1M4SP72_9BACT|nr:glycosyltransferase family A protein [Fodinibius roseus]SHE34043.1 Glycosyl transferase family 2 [Fodinibius roseus]